MTLRHQIEMDLAFLLIIGAILGFVFAINLNNFTKVRFLSMPAVENPQETNSAEDISPKIETFTQISSDGTKNLSVKIITNRDETKTYEFTTSDIDNSNQVLIYSATLNNEEDIKIPFNSWSPDNIFIFLEKFSPSGRSAIVMRANGQLFIDSLPYADIARLFAAKNTNNTYKETTGWASENLLIVNSTKQDGSMGPSYWFEVPSMAIIQLSTDFY